MADLYTKDDGGILDANGVNQHMSTLADIVTQIDGIKAGTDYYRLDRGLKKGFTQGEINAQVERCVGHIELMQKESWYKADTVTRSGNSNKSKHADAVTTGKKYITDNT